MTFKYTLVSRWITRPFEKKIDSMLSKIKHFFLRMLYLKAFYSLFVELSQSVFIELLFKMPHIVLNIKLISNMFHTLKHYTGVTLKDRWRHTMRVMMMMMMMMMTMIKVIKTYHENDQPAAGSDSAKPCTFGEIWLANSGDWVFLGVGGFRCKLRSWTLLLVLHGGSRIGLSSNNQIWSLFRHKYVKNDTKDVPDEANSAPNQRLHPPPPRISKHKGHFL